MGVRQGVSTTGTFCVLTLGFRGGNHLGVGPLGAWSAWPLGFRSWGTWRPSWAKSCVWGVGDGSRAEMPHLEVWSEWEPCWATPESKGGSWELPGRGRWSATGHEGMGYSWLWLQ